LRRPTIKYVLVLSALAVTGCATAPSTPIAATPTCTSDKDCEVKWAAARSYVLAHADMKIQTYSSDFLQTYNPPEYGTQIAAEVNKEPQAAGVYRISAKFWCNNLFGCSTPPRQLLDSFNRTVAAVQ
jgi:hypothetical protein